MGRKFGLDLKDRKLLYHLDQDARQSLTQLGKKIGLPKNVVAYRIKRLEERNVIESYFAIIDASKMGYTGLRIHLNFQYITPEKEDEIINYFTKQPDVWWCATTQGSVDCVIIMWVKDFVEFYKFWQATLNKYNNFFKNHFIHIYIQLQHYFYEYLLDKKRKVVEPLITACSNDQASVDKMDLKILHQLSLNARMPVTLLAQKVGCSAIQARSKIKRLKDSGIIKGYRVKPNLMKLGIVNVKLNLILKDHSKQKMILEYIKQCPNLVYVNKAIGLADIEVEFHIPAIEYVHKIVNDIKVEFPEMIRDYSYFIIRKENKKASTPT